MRLGVPISPDLPPVLGAGAYYKCAPCLLARGEAVVAEPIAALDSVEALAAYDRAVRDLGAMAAGGLHVAHDLHPDFYSTYCAERGGFPLHPVQHHHAHVAAVMAEHGVKGPVLGLACDGFGLGFGNEAWGGELLAVSPSGAKRVGRLRPLPQPGGDAAARAPWRMAAAALFALGRGDEIARRFAAFGGAPMLQVLERRINCPATSSMGRLFDAACGLLGVVPVAQFEGEAPMALEKLATVPRVVEGGWAIAERAGLLELDMLPLLARLADSAAEDGAGAFHGTLAAAMTAWVLRAAEGSSFNTVVLGGGCFMNRLLRERLASGLEAAKMTVLTARVCSPGDASIGLGQAYAAAMAMEEGL